MSDLYIETRLQAIKDIASASCIDIKDADNIASFCDEIYSAIPNLDKIVKDDIDEIVERLEAAKSEIASETYCKAVYNKGLCENRNCFECCAEYLIEIVKAGGKEC